MISKVGFMPQDIAITRLDEYVVTESDMEIFRESRTEPQNALDESSSCEYDDEEILASDLVLYNTFNDLSAELSYLEFHVFTDESELFLHHDIYIYSLIYDACTFRRGTLDYVALALESGTIDVYSFMIRNPFKPSISLKGHTDAVSSVTYVQNSIFSCGYDMYCYGWDVETQKATATKKFKKTLEMVEDCTSELSLISSSKGYFLSHDLDITATIPMKGLTGIKTDGHRVIVTDKSGNITEMDRRNMSVNVKSKKIHTKCINDLDVRKDRIVTVSDDMKVCILDMDFTEIQNIQKKNKIFSVSLYPYDDRQKSMFVCGGLDTNLSVHEFD